MKNILILPVIAILLIVTSIGDEWGSTPYLIKIIPAFILLIITVVLLLKNQKKTK
ncbi:MAG TPA: hypothetical protein PLG33_08955 [Prolixibacteraceae bacterium]|nr:hypothetical protein [Prolixibacteraceae bacterium]HPR86169.1 hypothetical protein [Prolixibacteraceae bacterium]